MTDLTTPREPTSSQPLANRAGVAYWLSRLDQQLERISDASNSAEHLSWLRDLAASAVSLVSLLEAEGVVDDPMQDGVAAYVNRLPMRPAVSEAEAVEQQQVSYELVECVVRLQMRALDLQEAIGAIEWRPEDVRAPTPWEVASMRAYEAREASRRIRWMAPILRSSRRPRPPRRAPRGRRPRARHSRAADDDGEPEPPGRGIAGRRLAQQVDRLARRRGRSLGARGDDKPAVLASLRRKLARLAETGGRDAYL
jgi:hypothetical protein